MADGFKAKIRMIFLLIVSVLIFSIFELKILTALKKSPEVIGSLPKSGQVINPQSPDITVFFSTPIYLPDLKVHSFPEIDMAIKPLGFLGNKTWANKIVMIPKTTLPPGQHLIVYLSDINGIFVKENEEYEIDLDTSGSPPKLTQTVEVSTRQKQIILDVPWFHQSTKFTCNIAAARMLLAFRGVEVSEQQLIDATGTSGPQGEGNPYKGFVSNYGTYWDALARGVSTFRSARMITSGKLSDIIAEIKKGNPVMIWGHNAWSTPRNISWTASDGTYIKAINGMHSVVVRGYIGPDNNPTQVFVNDPWWGQYTLATKEFMRRWSYFLMAMTVD